MSRRLLELAAAGAVLLLAPPARAQESGSPAGGWERWLGLEPGRTLVYESADGARTCAAVGRPLRLDGSLWLPIDRLPWPGFASDSRVLLPLSGPPRLGMVRTPGPRPRLDLLLPAADSLRHGRPPEPPRARAEADPSIPRGPPEPPPPLRLTAGDGWYAVGDPRDPELLVYVRCAMCMDAGLRVVLERGRGIVSMTAITLAGPTGFRRVEGGCAELEGADTEFEVYVIPDEPPR